MYQYKCMHLEHILDFTMLVRKEEMAMCSLCCVLNYDTETAVTYQWQINFVSLPLQFLHLNDICKA